MTRTKAYKRANKLLLPATLKPKETAPAPSIDSLPVNQAQCRKAVKALLAHLSKLKSQKEATELFSAEEHLYLVVTLKQMSGQQRVKPIRLTLPNPLYDPRKNPVCLFVKDPQREYKDLLESLEIGFISRVVGVKKLQGKFKPFEARRELMSSFDVFLADDRILPTLPKLLGRKWLEAKKQPIAVSMKPKTLKAQLERTLCATSLYLNRGTCTTIQLGTPETKHTEEQLYQNLLAILPQLAVRIPLGGWDNIQALHLKTSSSVALPIWNCRLAGDEDDTSSRFYAKPRPDDQEMLSDLLDEAKAAATEAGSSSSFAVEVEKMDTDALSKRPSTIEASKASKKRKADTLGSSTALIVKPAASAANEASAREDEGVATKKPKKRQSVVEVEVEVPASSSSKKDSAGRKKKVSA